MKKNRRTNTHTHTHTHTERERESERERHIQTEGEMDRQTNRQHLLSVAKITFHVDFNCKVRLYDTVDDACR